MQEKPPHVSTINEHQGNQSDSLIQLQVGNAKKALKSQIKNGMANNSSLFPQVKQHHAAFKFSTLYWIMLSLMMCSSHFDSSSLAGEWDLPRFCLFSEAFLGMSQEFCGVTWRKDSVVASRLILSRKSLWNLFCQQLNRDTADLKCFLLASQPFFHLDLAFLSCKLSYLTVFSPQSPSPFFCVDWGPGLHKAPAAWGRCQDCEEMWPFHPLKTGEILGEG